MYFTRNLEQLIRIRSYFICCSRQQRLYIVCLLLSQIMRLQESKASGKHPTFIKLLSQHAMTQSYRKHGMKQTTLFQNRTGRCGKEWLGSAAERRGLGGERGTQWWSLGTCLDFFFLIFIFLLYVCTIRFSIQGPQVFFFFNFILPPLYVSTLHSTIQNFQISGYPSASAAWHGWVSPGKSSI